MGHRELFGEVFGLWNRRSTTTIFVVKSRSTSTHIFVDLWQSIDLSICRSQFGFERTVQTLNFVGILRFSCLPRHLVRGQSSIFCSAIFKASRQSQFSCDLNGSPD